MNNEEILTNYKIKPTSIKKKKKATIITAGDKKYVIKNKNRESDFYNYLITRNFNNFPNVYSKSNDKFEITDYINEQETPVEQKIEDLIYLSSILHTKTTFYKNIDLDTIKEIYESTIDKNNELFTFYNDIQDMIETEVYMSPANYLLVRNISTIYLAIKESREYIEKWYNIMKQEQKTRYSYIHGNLKNEHLIEGNDLYLISWDKSRIDLPIYDLIELYKNSFLDISLDKMLEIYELKYPLKKEEFYLLISLLLIPDKIDLKLSEYTKTKQVANMILYFEQILIYLENNTNKSNYNT